MSQNPDTTIKLVAATPIWSSEAGTCAINNTVGRDWAQSNMEWNHPDHAIELIKAAAAYHEAVGTQSGALEVGGGTIPRFQLDKAGQNPFEHIRNIRKAVGKDVPLMMLVRSNAGGAMGDLPADVLKDYVKRSVEAGIDVVRNFHSHNDTRQFTNVYEATKEAGGHFQAAYSYAVSERDPTIFNPKDVVNFFKELEKQGVHSDSFALKDPAGVLEPLMAKLITREMRKAMDSGELPNKPFGIHTHNQGRFGEASGLAAALEGANFVDVGPSTGGFAAQPSAGTLLSMMESHGITTSLTDKPADVRKQAEQALHNLDTLAHNVSKAYQTSPDVAALTYRTSPGVKNHGVAGGQSSLLNKELLNAGMMGRRDEVLAKMAEVRADAGDTCQVTPFADRVLRETVRQVVNPNSKIQAEYAKELTGEAGPVQGVINPVKQRQAIYERLESVVGKELHEGMGINQIVDRMQEIYAPVRDAERLKLVRMRADELASIVEDAKTDKDYAAYVKVLNGEIARSGMKAADGTAVTNIYEAHDKLKAEAVALTKSIAGYKNPVSRADYEYLQKGKVSDALFERITEGNDRFKGAQFTREQMVAIMGKATITTIVASDAMEPALGKASAKVDAFFAEHNLPKPVSSQRYAEDVAMAASWGAAGMDGLSIADKHFIHRGDKKPFWEPAKKIEGQKTTANGVASGKPEQFMLVKFLPNEKPTPDELYKAIKEELNPGPADPRTIQVVEYGPANLAIKLGPKDYDFTRDAAKIRRAVEGLGGRISSPHESHANKIEEQKRQRNWTTGK